MHMRNPSGTDEDVLRSPSHLDPISSRRCTSGRRKKGKGCGRGRGRESEMDGIAVSSHYFGFIIIYYDVYLYPLEECFLQISVFRCHAPDNRISTIRTQMAARSPRPANRSHFEPHDIAIAQLKVFNAIDLPLRQAPFSLKFHRHRFPHSPIGSHTSRSHTSRSHTSRRDPPIPYLRVRRHGRAPHPFPVQASLRVCQSRATPAMENKNASVKQSTLVPLSRRGFGRRLWRLRDYSPPISPPTSILPMPTMLGAHSHSLVSVLPSALNIGIRIPPPLFHNVLPRYLLLHPSNLMVSCQGPAFCFSLH